MAKSWMIRYWLIVAVAVLAWTAAGPTRANRAGLGDSIRIDLDALAAKAIMRGDVCAAKGKYDCAIRDFDEALTYRRFNVEALKRRGFARFYGGDSGGAEADFLEAKHLAPDDPSSFYGLGLIFSRMRQFSRAIDAYTAALALSAGDTTILAARAHDYLLQRRGAPAMADAERVIRKEPGNTRARIDHAHGLILIGSPEKALTEIDRILQQTPVKSEAEAFYWRGEALVALDRPNEAWQAFTHSIGYEVSSSAYLARARLARLATVDARLTDVAQASALGADPASILIGRAQIEADSGQIAQALEDADQAQRMAQDDPDTTILRAGILARAGQSEAAMAALDALLARLPGDVEALGARCWLRVALKAPMLDGRANCSPAAIRSAALTTPSEVSALR